MGSAVRLRPKLSRTLISKPYTNCVIFLARIKAAKVQPTMQVLSHAQIACWLRVHQRRLRAGDPLPSMVEIARYAGTCRDSLYALIGGERVSDRTRWGISKAIHHFDELLAQTPKTRLMHVSLGPEGARLGYGVGVGAFRR